MSKKQFEDFLVTHFNSWAEVSLQPGYRYQFKSPDSSKGIKLYQAFVSLQSDTVEIKGTALPCINYGSASLIPVFHSEDDDGFSENFISHLRDEVSSQQGALKGCALLVIHNSLLDTLINSAENVAQAGFVWHPENIKGLLHQELDQKDEKFRVSECLLDYQFDQILDEQATMFGFEELYNAVCDGDLQFPELGLLNDETILSWDNKEQIQQRIQENKELSDELDFITEHFPNELPDKLASLDFSEEFVKEHFPQENPEQWRESLDLGQCDAEQQKNRTNLLELEKEDTLSGHLLKKGKSDRGAGKRERHLVLLLEPGQSAFNIEFTFINGRIVPAHCKIQHNKDQSDVKVDINNSGGVRSRVVLTSSFDGQARFFSLQVKTDKPQETHRFRVLVLQKGDFFVEGFEHIYMIDPAKKWVTLQTDEQTFPISEQTDDYEISENYQTVPASEYGKINFKQLASEKDEVFFNVQGEYSQLSFNVEGEVSTDSLSLPLLLDQGRFNYLFEEGYNGQYNRNKLKVLIDGKEIAPKARRLALLQYEALLLDGQILCKYQSEDDVCLDDIQNEFPELFAQYKRLFDYLYANKTLLSIAGWEQELREIVTKIVEVYTSEIVNIPYDAPLSPEHKKLVLIGFAEVEEQDTIQEYITPFHPSVLAYNLNVAQALLSDKLDSGSFKDLPAVTIKRLSAQGLLPFVYHPTYEFSYNHAEKENVFWSKLIPQQDSNYDFVRALVSDKVEKFTAAFKHLFVAGSKTTLLINSVNNQHNEEVFLGIIDYVKRKKDKITRIHVNLYNEEDCYSWFDKFADTASYDEIKELCELNKGSVKEQSDTIVDLLRTRLTYSKYPISDLDDSQEYAHICFFKNNERVRAEDINVSKQQSGVVCHGLMPGETASNKHGSFYTAFGLSGVDTQSSPPLKLIERYSALVKPARSNHVQYTQTKSQALVVTDNFKNLLEVSYKNAIWTTIIDPKVTLDFFEGEKDMVLIHYSDNYTNSVNYDAITVTKQTDLYHKVLDNDNGGLIEEFNAFNGEWLLNLVTANKNERKEKRGILGAYKFVNCLLHKSDITWVPVSIAEIIRVAGNLGLKAKESDFSRFSQGFKSGAISDDVLFVGFKDDQLILLPVEVKTGKRQTHSKGVTQAKELKRYFEDLLGKNTLASHLYRGLFIRQILMQIDKYKLYNVYKDGYFNQIIDNSAWWLQGDYSLSQLGNYPEAILFVNVEDKDFTKANFMQVQDVLKVEIPAGDLTDSQGNISQLLRTPLQKLYEDLTPAQLYFIDENYVLNGETQIEPVASCDNSGYSKPELSTVSNAEEPVDKDLAVEQELANAAEPKQERKAERKKMADKDLLSLYQRIIDCYYSYNIPVSKPSDEAPYVEGPASILFRIELNPGTDPRKLFEKSQALKLDLKLEQEQEVGFAIDKGCVTIDVPKNDSQRYYVDQHDIWPTWQRPENALEVPLGEDRFGNVVKINFSSSNCPHLLIGGTTGSGKSEALNTILYGMCEHYSASELKLMLIDPKGTELNDFEKYPHLLGQIGWDDEDALQLLSEAVEEMQNRYSIFKKAGVRSLPDYNEKVSTEERIPWWVLVLDEYADLTSDKDMKKDIEAELKRLAQKARAAGIHLIIATQKPSGDVISTNLRSNLPAQLALRVKNGTESRVILDEQGAEVLNGKGDAYLKSEGKLVRIQCARIVV